MEIIVCDSPHDVAVQAADILQGYANEGGVLGVATGSTPLLTYQELIRRHKAGEVSFAGCTMFALDEYVGLPIEHEQSYYRVIHDEFSDHVDIDPADVHIPNGLADDVPAACAEYEQAIVDAGGIDVQLLGIGTNGHVGFNEPASSLSSLTRMKTLHPQTVADNARFFNSLDEVPIHVVTQGLGTIQRAGQLVLIATGEHKAHAVAQLAEGPLSASCPASVLQIHPHATVIVDEAAASKLHNVDYYKFIQQNKPQ